MARAAVVLVLSLALSCVDAFTPAAFAPRLAAAESRRASSGVGRGRWRRLRLASTVAEEATELAGDLASGDSSMWEAGAESYVLSTVERARTVAAACASGTLSTACQAQEGFPFGSHVDFILDEHGWPVLLLNEGALHTKNVLADQVPFFCRCGAPHFPVFDCRQYEVFHRSLQCTLPACQND